MPKGIGRPLNRGEKIMNRVRPGSGTYANRIGQHHRELGLHDKMDGSAGKTRAQAASDSVKDEKAPQHYKKAGKDHPKVKAYSSATRGYEGKSKK